MSKAVTRIDESQVTKFQEQYHALTKGEAAVGEYQRPYSAEQITEQYRKAVSGCLEMIRFGAMMIEVESGLMAPAQSRGGHYDGETLKTWLEDNCPAINYKTALRFKGLAEGLQFHLRIPDNWPLRLALPSGTDQEADVNADLAGELGIKPKRLAQMRKEIWDFLEGKSARQLVFDFGCAETAPKGGDRRSGLKMTEEEKHDRSIQMAQNIWLESLETLLGEARICKSLMLFDEGMLDAILLKLDTIRDAVKAAKEG
jgi:hypothetical protein